MKTNAYKIALAVNMLLLSVMACSTAAFPAPQPTAVPALPPTTLSLSQSVTLTSTSFNEQSQTPIYKITAQIPYLQGSDDPRVQIFNTKLKGIVDNEIASFKKDVSQPPTMPISAGSSFGMQYEMIAQRGHVWSIKFEVMVYMDGAAHPGHHSVTVNYDLENSRDLTLDEIFLPGSNYLQTIADYCKAQLSTRDIAFDSFTTGADPTPENYHNWNVTNDGLMITFDEYQVAPYAAGPQMVTVPYSVLGQMVNYHSPLAPFLP